MFRTSSLSDMYDENKIHQIPKSNVFKDLQKSEIKVIFRLRYRCKIGS